MSLTVTCNFPPSVPPRTDDEDDNEDDLGEIQFVWTVEGNLSSWQILGDSAVKYPAAKWREFLAGQKMRLDFGDEYGSHVDNGTVSIIRVEDAVLFEVDGARGGVMHMRLPFAACLGAFNDVITALEEYTRLREE
jgi:hypothetical protein